MAAPTKVRDAIRLIQAEGWILIAAKGSHRQFRHILKPGRVTIAGKDSDDLAPGTLNSIPKQGAEGKEVMRYAVVIEKAGRNYSAMFLTCRDALPPAGSIAAVEKNLREAIRLHIDAMKQDRVPTPEPITRAEHIEA